MATPKTATMPQDLDLGGGYVLQFTALDATTGAAVTSVIVSQATVTVHNVGGGAIGEILVPTDFSWLNLPVSG